MEAAPSLMNGETEGLVVKYLVPGHLISLALSVPSQP